MVQPPDWQVIDRHLAGEATQSDALIIRAWLEGDPAANASITALRAELAADAGRSRWNTRVALRRVRAGNARPPQFTTRRMAAAAVIVIAAVSVWWTQRHRDESGVVTTSSEREVTTPNGARTTVTLADGSRITLNAGSKLRYVPGTGSGAREVSIEGEGYFDVVHDAARPFRIHARDAVIEDVGTRFVVRAYPEMARLHVIVSEGAVTLRRAGAGQTSSALLRAGDAGTMAATGPVVVEQGVDAAESYAWIAGILEFRDVTLAEARPQLERWYDVRLVLADSSLGARRFTASFKGEPLSSVLDALSLALGARHSEAGRTVTLTLEQK